ncbi:MAG: hypothetical protein M3R30_04885 [Candidatus Eremiobacteraeota bacterium]|nr:hypothetical protein [Candidatus Eremiobacteraeota bacterium]
MLIGAALVLAGLVAVPPPVRHLVYSFTYTNAQTQTAHDSGISNSSAAGRSANAPISGVAESRADTDDRGTVTVDVIRVQEDTGLVVSISEQARGNRSARPAVCVAYGNTNVICDPDSRVTTEEFALLRLMGQNFVDPAQIDAKNHWRVEQVGRTNSDTADFSIRKNDSGVMLISSVRVLHATGPQGFTSTSDGTIGYDYVRLIPTSVGEDETIRQDDGIGSYTTLRTRTMLVLIDDSAAKKP